MARPQKSRKISNPPKMKGFRPFGLKSCMIEAVVLKFEEYESIRLINYEMLPQDTAAKQMNISRATFGRILDGARNKVAGAIIKGQALKIEPNKNQTGGSK